MMEFKVRTCLGCEAEHPDDAQFEANVRRHYVTNNPNLPYTSIKLPIPWLCDSCKTAIEWAKSKMRGK